MFTERSSTGHDVLARSVAAAAIDRATVPNRDHIRTAIRPRHLTLQLKVLKSPGCHRLFLPVPEPVGAMLLDDAITAFPTTQVPKLRPGSPSGIAH